MPVMPIVAKGRKRRIAAAAIAMLLACELLLGRSWLDLVPVKARAARFCQDFFGCYR